jgi:hypothetical protein
MCTVHGCIETAPHASASAATPSGTEAMACGTSHCCYMVALHCSLALLSVIIGAGGAHGVLPVTHGRLSLVQQQHMQRAAPAVAPVRSGARAYAQQQGTNRRLLWHAPVHPISPFDGPSRAAAPTQGMATTPPRSAAATYFNTSATRSMVVSRAAASPAPAPAPAPAAAPTQVFVRGVKPYQVCTSSWEPMVTCTPGADPSQFTGYQLELFR